MDLREQDEITAQVIELEKRLCVALKREWRPSGMSLDSLITDVSNALAAQQDGAWQPIETAPKDRHIWVWGKGHGLGGGFTWQGAACWDDVFPSVPAGWGYLPAGIVPEFWRELPTPPRT